MNLLLPVAGMSTRFPNMKPKWLLTSPNGNLMIIEAILGLELSHFNKIYIITINDHLLEFDFIDGIKNQFSQIGYLDKLEFIILDEKTKSQPETIAKAIIQKGIKGGIYIKDSDNYFIETRQSGNFISTFDLNKMDLVHAKNKSYVVTNDEGAILNIVEKKVLGSIFNVGGYGFDSAENYLKYYKLVISSLRPGGYVIADNVLWSGKVVDNKINDEDTESLRMFNDALSNDSII